MFSYTHASVRYRQFWQAKDGIQPTSNFATWDTRASSSNTIDIVADFDASTTEYLVFLSNPMRFYRGGGLTVTCTGMMSSATKGNVILQAQFRRIRPGTDAIGDAFSSAVQSSATAVPGTSGNYFDVSITLTDGSQIDSVVNNDRYALMISRASSTATGDYELLAVEVRETGT